MNEKNLAAQMLVSIRWNKTTQAQRSAHAKMMVEARIAKKARKIRAKLPVRNSLA
jgi:hypothetical protein